MWQILLSGLLLGLVSSLHCVGMCGPLSLALPLVKQGLWSRIIGYMTYHVARITTYILMGFVVGLLNLPLQSLGFQRWISIAAGISLLFIFLYRYCTSTTKRQVPAWLQPAYDTIQSGMYRQASKSTTFSYWWFGMLNGLLPCGMVYLALASSFSLGSLTHSMMFMGSFGLGTLPLLLLIFTAGNLFQWNMRLQIRRWLAYTTLVVGLLLVLRGLNLGIPWISPHLDAESLVKAHAESCLR